MRTRFIFQAPLVNRDAHSEWHFVWRQRSLRKLSVLNCGVCDLFSRVNAPQWGSLTDTCSHGPLNARDPALGDLYGGCGGKKTRSVITGSGDNMKSLRKWNSARTIWIIFPEMILFSVLWFLSQTRAAPSITTEQMDMGVVGALSSLSYNYRLGKRRGRKPRGLWVAYR